MLFFLLYLLPYRVVVYADERLFGLKKERNIRRYHMYRIKNMKCYTCESLLAWIAVVIFILHPYAQYDRDVIININVYGSKNKSKWIKCLCESSQILISKYIQLIITIIITYNMNKEEKGKRICWTNLSVTQIFRLFWSLQCYK